jgi:hypothetical protein
LPLSAGKPTFTSKSAEVEVSTMVHAVAWKLIHAPPARLMALYLDYQRWPALFPATIRGVRLLGEHGEATRLVIDHATEGEVINILKVLGPSEIQLEEMKPRYDARFINRFEAVPGGTRYSVVAEIALKGRLRALAPIAAPFVRARLDRYVLEPMRASAEGEAVGAPAPG